MATEKAREMEHARTLKRIAGQELTEAKAMKCGGKVKKAAGGRINGIAKKGWTKGKMV
jgi:hypothetical protein